MSYLVLARKYRPATFSEVVGQEHVTRTLANAFASGRVHHAFLFCGPRGCGKTTLARIVGKALNCERRSSEPGAAADPCNACSACTTISNGSAVDYQEMDGASNRGIDAIRELTEAVRYQPAVLRKKVYVIDEVHMLTTEAFNALLKTLEEPPPHVTFVLATTEPHKLPNTILSRCQRYDFKLVPASRLAQHLAKIFVAESIAIESNAISLIVRESGGSVRDALSLCDQLISYVGDGTISERHVAEVLGVADRSLTRTLVRSLATGQPGTALGAVESAIERGVDEIQIARAIVRYLRDLSVLQVAPDRPELVDASEEERVELGSEAKQLERSRVTQMFERMLRCCDELGKTLQPRLVLDCALIDVATVEPLVPLGDLVERLGEIEARLVRGGARPATRPAEPRAFVSPSGALAPRAARSEHSAVDSVRSVSKAPVIEQHPGGQVSVRPSEVVSAAEPVRKPAPSFATGTDAGSRPPVKSAAAMAAPQKQAQARTGDSVAPRAGAGHMEVASVDPSGPVPKPAAVASGSGPHDESKLVANPPDLLAAWNGVLGELENRRKFTLLGPFQHARVMKWGADEIELGFPVDVHSMGEMAIEKHNVDELRAIIRELGKAELANVKLTVRLLDATQSGQGARSVLEDTREKTAAERHKREAEAREHPIVKHVTQTFGAQIKEIKTDV